VSLRRTQPGSVLALLRQHRARANRCRRGLVVQPSLATKRGSTERCGLLKQHHSSHAQNLILHRLSDTPSRSSRSGFRIRSRRTPLRMVAADANFAVSSSYFPPNLTLSAFGKKQNDGPLSVINVKSQLSITASTTRPNPDLKSPNPAKAIQISDVDDFLRRYAAIPCACECGRIWRAP
jgi:hypothetical protein